LGHAALLANNFCQNCPKINNAKPTRLEVAGYVKNNINSSSIDITVGKN
jgi:hypothetical protein